MTRISLLLVAFLLVAGSARADERLPGGVTCEQIVRYAADLGISNTHAGRAQARIIALTFGIVVTNAQLDAAAQCLTAARIGKPLPGEAVCPPYDQCTPHGTWNAPDCKCWDAY